MLGVKLNGAKLFRAKFDGSILDGAQFRKARLGYATFNPLSYKKTSLQAADFKGADLSDTEFREADLTAALFHGQVDQDLLPATLKDTDFRKANLFRANFTGCYFYGTKLEGAFIRGADLTLEGTRLGDADWGNYQIGEESGNGHQRDLWAAEHRYRQLKAWYTTAGYDTIASAFRYREIEAHRKGTRLFSKSGNDRLALQLSFWVFGHGEGWKRLLFWIAGIILSFTVLYYFIGTLNPGSFLDCLYYSGVSFIAVGYGGWINEAAGWAKGLGVFETFLGFFMMTLLLVTFVRKWTR